MNQTLSPAQLAAYFDRIGYIVPDRWSQQATSETLHALHRLHPQAIPFENLDSLLGRTPSLNLASVFAKLVSARRGGYCYEHKLLFRAVLDTLGFETTGLAARVLWNDPIAMAPRTHMMLLVETPDDTWLADVGFGSMTLSALLLFDADREQAMPHEPFRLDLIERGDFMLQVKYSAIPGGRSTVSTSNRNFPPTTPSRTTHYVSTYPDSIFVNHLVVARVVPGERQTLYDMTLTQRGETESRRELANPAELRSVLQDVFGLTAGNESDALLEHIPRLSTSTTA